MNPVFIWSAQLKVALHEAKNAGKITDLEEQYNLPLTDDDLQAYLPEVLKRLFTYANEMKIQWRSANKDEAGGQLHFLDKESFLKNGEGILFQAETTDKEERIRDFKAIDLITSEAHCGLLIDSESVNPELYYNETGYNQLHGLDIDFPGYLEMALAARIYYYWPKVLLDIQSGEESTETVNFKHNMPLIFPDFSWEEFKEKYQTLRLSTK